MRNCVGLLQTDLHGTLVSGPYPCTKFERNWPSRSWLARKKAFTVEGKLKKRTIVSEKTHYGTRIGLDKEILASIPRGIYVHLCRE